MFEGFNLTELRRALRLAWLAVSLLLLLLTIAPSLLPQSWIAAAAPRCSAKARGSSCALCGMTTAFLHLSRGDTEEASRSNRASLPLFGFFLINGMTALVLVARVLKGDPQCRR